MDEIESKKIRYKLKKYQSEDHQRDNRKNKKIISVLSVMIFVSFIFGAVLSYKFLSINPTYDSTEIKKIKQAYNVLANDWYFSGENELSDELIDLAIIGMTKNQYDKHVYYQTKDQALEMNASMSGSFVGIGIQFYIIEDEYLIEQVMLNSPAKKAGLMPGDILYKIDDIPVKGKDTKQLKEMVTGEVGTNVKVTVLRSNKEIDFDIRRDHVYGSITQYDVNDDTLMLRLDQFAASTGDEFKLYLESNPNKKNLIIDLRDNGGGYLGALTQIGELLLPKDSVIIGQKNRNQSISQIKTKDNDYYKFDKIIIFTNQYSASASEALTMALRENLDNVTVMGTTTYGKGTVQVPYMFSDGSVLNYTAAKWLSPKNNSIHEVGIEPDIEVFPNEFYSISTIKMEKSEYKYDQVAEDIKSMQKILMNIGYNVDRADGYFSKKTEEALNQFKIDHKIEANGILDEVTSKLLISSYFRYAYENKFELDNCYKKALEFINE